MRITFVGTGEIGVPALQALLRSEHEIVAVVTQPDKPVGRAQSIEPSPIKKALTGGALPIPILQPARIRERQIIEEIRAFVPDVIVVMAYGQILPREVLEIPKVACLNLHASLLPRWRGAAPIQAAIAAGDQETGVTVMYMDEGLDTGDILLARKIDIRQDESGGSLHDRLAQMAPDALLDSLGLLAKGNPPRIPQDNSLVTNAPKLKREDGRINWLESAQTIQRRIRAFNPWPGAFMTIGGRNLKIFSATVIDRSGKPGQILRSDKALVIATGKDAILIGEVQLEGKNRMSAQEFLRGHAGLLRDAD
jgi:methionyl-tRNA formyltransferase